MTVEPISAMELMQDLACAMIERPDSAFLIVEVLADEKGVAVSGTSMRITDLTNAGAACLQAAVKNIASCGCDNCRGAITRAREALKQWPAETRIGYN